MPPNHQKIKNANITTSHSIAGFAGLLSVVATPLALAGGEVNVAAANVTGNILATEQGRYRITGGRGGRTGDYAIQDIAAEVLQEYVVKESEELKTRFTAHENSGILDVVDDLDDIWFNSKLIIIMI